ncbi:hypothetical protein DL240_11580 [Lujinxingia litoralis]|uniref:Uncharacterized protein n=1 Tax=Lujinxingia litoralis TaxID=2211119 RepID=A0A328C5G6_9DELT|nr:hypothetical protein [Lujinxingia litoralis]RAL22479.1 hypothetical protein DL240_11580 [Lujinxingia litoralis]
MPYTRALLCGLILILTLLVACVPEDDVAPADFASLYVRSRTIHDHLLAQHTKVDCICGFEDQGYASVRECQVNVPDPQELSAEAVDCIKQTLYERPELSDALHTYVSNFISAHDEHDRCIQTNILPLCVEQNDAAFLNCLTSFNQKLVSNLPSPEEQVWINATSEAINESCAHLISSSASDNNAPPTDGD